MRQLGEFLGRFLAIALGIGIAGLLAWAASAADPTGSNTRPFGSLPALTFATLPPAVAGTEAYISDGLAANCADTTCTTFGTNVTGGGGALKLLLWSNGVNWTLIGK